MAQMQEKPSRLPSVSMVVSTYQRREMVCDTVRAIGEIEYDGDFELIVVIDGSQDGTREALEVIELPFPSTIIWQENHGLGHARNRGAEAATGDIVFFLDDDMICRPDIIAQHVKLHLDGADAVLGEIPLEDNSPPGFLTEGIAQWAAGSATESRSLEKLTPFQIFGGQLSVSSKAFKDLEGFDTQFTANGQYGQEDADFGVKLLAKYDVRHAREAVSYHRYIVTPKENMRRAFQAGRADVMFLRRHPTLAPSLFRLKRFGRRLVRYVYRPLGRLPLFPQLFALAASRMAAVALRTRYRSSSIVARIYGAAQQIAYWSAVQRHGGMANGEGALVLCYHAIADHSHDAVLSQYSVPRETFEAHIRSLERRGFNFVSADDLLQHLKGLCPLPKKAVLLTFDDCYTDLLETARAVLQPKGIPALAFAVTGLGSATNEWDQAHGIAKLDILGSEGLRALEAAGVTIGSHARTHRPLPGLVDAELTREVAGSMDDLEQAGVRRPRYFAYPYGMQDSRCIEAVDRAGYALGFGLADRVAKPGQNMFNVHRVMIHPYDSRLRFWLKTSLPTLTSYLLRRVFKAT